MSLVINRVDDVLFDFQLDGGDIRSDNAPNLTTFNNLCDFKTKNGANLYQRVPLNTIEVVDTFGGTGTFTFLTVLALRQKLRALKFFDGAGSSGGGVGVDRFDNLEDTFSYFGNDGKVPVVNLAMNKMVATPFYNVQNLTDLADCPSILVADKMFVVNSAGTGVILVDKPQDPQEYLNAYGWAIYTDTGLVQNYLTASGDVVIENDSVEVIDTYKPFGVVTFYDNTTNSFDFSSLNLGDVVTVKGLIDVQTSNVNQNIKLKINTAIGGSTEDLKIIYDDTKDAIDNHNVIFDFSILIDRQDLIDFPTQLIINSDFNADVIVDSYNISAIRRDINFTTITAIDETASHYKGNYNVITNIPILANGVGQIGDYYTLTTAGSRNFGSGSISFGIGDRIEFDGFAWFKAVNNNQSGGGGGGAVDSVDGLTGVLTTGQIVNSLTEKVTIVDNDLVGGSDSEASNVSKKWKFSTVSTYVLSKLGAYLFGLTAKTTPVDADTITINDTADSNVLKQLSFTNLKAFLKTYFDTLYLVPSITITTAVSITTDTTDGSGFGQNGRDTTIDNGANAINITVNGGAGKIFTGFKGGTGAISFVAGSGRTITQMSGTLIMNGAIGSTYAIKSVGTIDYLYINNY